MDFQCANCDNQIELPDMIINPSDLECDFCYTNLNIEINFYLQCEKCYVFYLNIYEECQSCNYKKVPKIDLSSNYFTNYIYVKTKSDYDYALRFVENKNLLALDTEGNGLDVFTAQLFLIQIGNEEIVFIFDFIWFDRLKKEKFWEDYTKLWIIHNAKFDYKMIKHNLGISIENIFDTMLAERILTCGLVRENSLKAISRKYLSLERDKTLRMDFTLMNRENFHDLITQELLEYSAQDVHTLIYLYEIQKVLLRNEHLEDIADLEFQAVIPISEIELAGIYVDTDKWRKIIEHNEKESNRVKKEIYEYINLNCKKISSKFEIIKSDALFELDTDRQKTNVKFNLNSTHTLKNIFKDLNINLEDTSDQTLALLKHPLADLIREYRGFEKQLNAFGESFLDLVRKETNRVHPTFNQIGADTGRMSCTKPNMQQIPATEEYRSCFIAPANRKIVTCDYSQQELRLLASLSGDPKFIKMYEDGVDLHSATASLMYNISIEEVPKDKRSAAKTINFGLAYGRGAKALADFLGISTEEGEEMIKIYFSQFSYIGDWLNNAAKSAQTLGFSQTLIGRKRYYKLPHKNNPEYKSILARIGRQGKNSPIQGSGVDMVKMALIIIRKKLLEEKLDAFLVNTVHDEIVIESSEKDSEKAYKIIESSMIDAGKTIVKNVPILAEASINDFWKH